MACSFLSAILQTLLSVQHLEELSEKKNKNIYYHMATISKKNFRNNSSEHFRRIISVS
ncbi:unnamed protein product [Tenebrio molitor]|nr:unnamed protein product [Tenebrio molitor]